MDSQKIRVVILDDSPKFRKHLVELLGKEPDINVVAEADHGPAGINQLETHQPDVILVNGKEPFTDRIESTSLVVGKFPNTRVIILSMESKSSMLPRHSKHTLTASSCQTWACYPLCQGCTDKEILAAIREGHQQG